MEPEKPKHKKWKWILGTFLVLFVGFVVRVYITDVAPNLEVLRQGMSVIDSNNPNGCDVKDGNGNVAHLTQQECQHLNQQQRELADTLEKQQEYAQQTVKTKSRIETTDDNTALFQLSSPTNDQVITSPLAIQGKVQLAWMPEGYFRTKLVDCKGVTFAKGSVNAAVYPLAPDSQGSIPVRGELVFPVTKCDTGTLILEEAEYSQIKAGDLKIQIRFR